MMLQNNLLKYAKNKELYKLFTMELFVQNKTQTLLLGMDTNGWSLKINLHIKILLQKYMLH